jgi:hypothetical protein
MSPLVLVLMVGIGACEGSDASSGDLGMDAVEMDVSMDADADVSAPDDVADDPGQDPGATDDATSDVPDDPGADAAEDVADPFDVEVVTTPGGLPWSLPFRYERPDLGTPPSQAEITAFTQQITGLWKQIDVHTWAAETSAGVDVSSGHPDYLIWWHDFNAVKEGDLVTFQASAADGGSHNNVEPTGVFLANTLVAHLRAPDDESIRYLAEQYTKSVTACQKGFVFDEDDGVDWLFARNIAVTFDQEFTMPSGKRKAVAYDEWFFSYTGWNADRFRYEHNPTWGDIWVTNKRSKDDLPYMWRVGAWLPYVVELTPDDALRAAAEEALDLLEKGARDIVDSGWLIRTKDENGDIYVPESEDLASFVAYTGIIPDAECDARLSAALLGYGDGRDQDCGTGQGSLYDQVAGQGNYFNYDIINHFHQAAALLALTNGHAEMARELVRGLAIRAERYLDPEGGEPGWTNDKWERDISLFLLRSAAVGLPLTSDEARLVLKYHVQTVDAFRDYERWDLWDESVPDGTYSFRHGGFHPESGPQVYRAEDMTSLIEYCGSPFRNPAGAAFVDCDVVLDPTRWGTAPEARAD